MDFSLEPFNIAIVAGSVIILLIVALPIYTRLSKSKYHQRRKADRSPMSRKQAQVFERAKQLFNKRQFVPAAQLLESIGRQREAVQMLEEGGHIDDAAGVLMRMQRPNRAGVIYARHAMWSKAVDCFRLANMPLEVARCAREQGDFKTAADFFLQSEHYAEAAECFADAGDSRNAARNYVKSGYDRKATDIYIQMLDANGVDGLAPVDEEELTFFVEQLSRGNGPVSFARVLDHNERLHEAVYNLLRYGNYTEAARHLASAQRDYTEKLNTMVSGHDYASQNLSRAYDINGQFTASGKLFEMLGNYARATVSYIKAGATVDAERCKGIAVEIEKAKSEDRVNFTDIHADDTLVLHLPAQDTSVQEPNVKEDEPNKHMYASLARKINIFSDLTLDERLAILSSAREQAFAKGDVLAKENSSPAGLFIIAEGEVRVSEPKASTTEFRKELQAGELFGEGWVFFDELLPASYQAKTSGKYLEISKDVVLGELDKNPTLARRLYKSLLRQWRLQALTHRNNYEKDMAS